MNCRLCGSCCPETIDHLLTGCSVIAQSWYKVRHDAVDRIDWELAKKGNFEIVTEWWKHHPVPVMHNSYFKLMEFHHSD